MKQYFLHCKFLVPNVYNTCKENRVIKKKVHRTEYDISCTSENCAYKRKISQITITLECESFKTFFARVIKQCYFFVAGIRDTIYTLHVTCAMKSIFIKQNGHSMHVRALIYKNL